MIQRFDYLKPGIGPVVDGLEDKESIIALEQANYIPLRVLHGKGGLSNIYRCELTQDQRIMVAQGADVLVEIITFGGPMAPSRVMLINQAYFQPEESKVLMAEWFVAQANVVKLGKEDE